MIGLAFLVLSVLASFGVSLVRGEEYALAFALGNFLIASSFLFAARNAYKYKRLIEPATFFIVIQYIIYGPANWLPVAGVDMYIHNPGSLEYYPTAALLAGMGMWMYVLVYDAVRIRYDPVKPMCSVQIGYGTLLVLSLGCTITYFVLSAELGQRHGFEGAGKGLTGMTNWIALALPVAIFAVTASVAFYWNKNWSLSGKLVISLAVLANIVVTATFVSRTRLMLIVGTFFMILMQRELIAAQISRGINVWKNAPCNTYSPAISVFSGKGFGKGISKTVFVSAIALMALITSYLAGTFIKSIGISEDKLAGVERLEAMTTKQIKGESIRENAATDISYRMACLELPAAILASQHEGRNWLWGESFMLGLAGSLPNFLSTELGIFKDKSRDKQEVESNLIYHFSLVETDQTGSVLASAVADFGPFGVFIFFPLLALFHGKFLLRLYLNPTTTIAYFCTLPYIMLFDHYFDAQVFELLKFLGFLMLVFLPFTIWRRQKFRLQKLRGRVEKVTSYDRVVV